LKNPQVFTAIDTALTRRYASDDEKKEHGLLLAFPHFQRSSCRASSQNISSPFVHLHVGTTFYVPPLKMSWESPSVNFFSAEPAEMCPAFCAFHLIATASLLDHSTAFTARLGIGVNVVNI